MTMVAVVTDSTADLPLRIAQDLDIHVVPLNVRIGHQAYEDRVTISPEEFMEQLVHTSEFPTTSQPSIGRFELEYARLAKQYDEIISIHISSKLSGTYQSACVAREQVDSAVPIRVLDSGTTTMGLGLNVIRAARLAQCGCSAAQIEAAIRESLKRTHVAFLIDTLEYLRRGGRIGRAAEVVGSILKLKPILRIEEGIVVPHARTRTRARAIDGLIDLIAEIPSIEEAALMYTAGTEDLGRVAEQLRPHVEHDALIMTEISPVLSAHIGPRGMGVAVIEKESS